MSLGTEETVWFGESIEGWSVSPGSLGSLVTTQKKKKRQLGLSKRSQWAILSEPADDGEQSLSE